MKPSEPVTPSESETPSESVSPSETKPSESTTPGTEIDPTKYIYINADGNIYQVEAGSDHKYVYYLQDTKPVCGVDASTTWDAPEISRIDDPIFPNLDAYDAPHDDSWDSGVMYNYVDLTDGDDGPLVQQQVLFNYTDVDGADFTAEDSVLISFNIHVDEETQPGIYYITTKIKTLEGPDEEQQIFEDTVLTPDEIPYREGVLDGEIPVRKYDDPMEYTADEQTYVLGSGEEKTFTAKAVLDFLDKGTYDKFQYVTIDGTVVSYRDYTKASGSLLLTLKPDYMDKLSVGDHEVKFFFTDGTATGILHVLAAETPTYQETETSVEETKKPAAATTAQSSTSDSSSTTSGSAVQTGSPEIAIFFVVILVMAAGIIIFTKKRKED